MRMRYQLLCVFFGVALVLATMSGALFAQSLKPYETPVPSIDTSPAQTPPDVVPPNRPETKDINDGPQGAPPLGATFGAMNFDTNGLLTGFLFIPPDPHGAAGPFHVVNVCNVAIEWYTKAGVQQNSQSLQTFFAPVSVLGTFTFDPKVIYDQYNERFVVIALERWDTAAGDPANDSWILVAVSKGSDPNLGWWMTAIHSSLLGTNGIMSWADYPGLAVDDKAVYITNNMFNYISLGGAYAGSYLWIIDKNPFYTGGAAVVTQHDPYTATAANNSVATTTQPAHMFGPVPGAMGTYLCSHSGLTDGVNEYVQVIRVDSPLAAPVFTHQFINVGDIDPVLVGLSDAPQFGTATLIEVNDRRALNAVWRDNNLYISATIEPNAGPDAAQTTAHWFRVDTTVPIPGLTLGDQGNVGAENLGAGTWTFFPSVMVDYCGNMAMGFSASNQGFYASACYTGRLAGDAPGTTQPAGIMISGVDWYVRTFGAGRNRWGDYSGISLDPTDQQTFWVFNEYAGVRGTPTGAEDGRWETQWGSFVMGCPPVSVAITGFEARVVEGGVELTSTFSTDSEAFRVNVYRGDQRYTDPVLYKSLEMKPGDEFRFVDKNVEPGQTYAYFIGAVDKDGEFFSQTSRVTIPTTEVTLGQNKPNPFNPVTTISFSLPTAQQVTLSIYDANGSLVKRLVDGVREHGTHRIEWNGTDSNGNPVGSGVYFYKLQTGNFTQARKMVLLK